MDFQSFNQDDEEDGAELFFEGPEPAVEAVEAPPPAAVIAPVPPAKNIAPAAAAALPAAAAEDPLAAAPLPDPEAPATPAVEKPAVPATPRVMNIALILAAIASLFSAIGLLVSVRNVAVLHEQQKEAEHRAATFERLPALLADVEKLAADQRAELARAAATSPSALVTADELSRQLNALRFALAKNQAPGTTTLAGVVRRGQEELTHRIDDINERIDKLEPKGRH